MYWLVCVNLNECDEIFVLIIFIICFAGECDVGAAIVIENILKVGYAHQIPSNSDSHWTAFTETTGFGVNDVLVLLGVLLVSLWMVYKVLACLFCEICERKSKNVARGDANKNKFV